MIHDITPQENQSSQKLIYLSYFPYSYQLKIISYWRLFTMKKKTVKKTKTTTNTLFPYCPRSIILESLFLNTCCLGQKV